MVNAVSFSVIQELGTANTGDVSMANGLPSGDLFVNLLLANLQGEQPSAEQTAIPVVEDGSQTSSEFTSEGVNILAAMMAVQATPIQNTVNAIVTDGQAIVTNDMPIAIESTVAQSVPVQYLAETLVENTKAAGSDVIELPVVNQTKTTPLNTGYLIKSHTPEVSASMPVVAKTAASLIDQNGVNVSMDLTSVDTPAADISEELVVNPGRQSQVMPSIVRDVNSVNEQQVTQAVARTIGSLLEQKPANTVEQVTALASEQQVTQVAARAVGSARGNHEMPMNSNAEANNISSQPNSPNAQQTGAFTMPNIAVENSIPSANKPLDEVAAPIAANKPEGAIFAHVGNGVAEAAINRVNVAASENAQRPEANLATRIIDQVVRQVKLRKFADGSDLVVRLNPPDLGAMRVQIVQDAQGITSHITASSEQVRGLLQAHLPALVEALSSAGLRMDSVSVSADQSFSGLMNNNAQGGSHNSAGQQHRYNGSAQTSANPMMANANVGAFQTNSQVGYSWLA